MEGGREEVREKEGMEGGGRERGEEMEGGMEGGGGGGREEGGREGQREGGGDREGWQDGGISVLRMNCDFLPATRELTRERRQVERQGRRKKVGRKHHLRRK